MAGTGEAPRTRRSDERRQLYPGRRTAPIPRTGSGRTAAAATAEVSAGARSPRGSTTTVSRPSQPARRSSSAASSSAVSSGAPASAQAAFTSSRPVLAVGLEVDPAHDLVAEEERQHVVAVHALVRRACRSRCGSGSRTAARCARAPTRPGRRGSARRAPPTRRGTPRVAVEVRRAGSTPRSAPGPAPPPRRARRPRRAAPAASAAAASGSSRPGSAPWRRRGTGPRGGPARGRPPRRWRRRERQHVGRGITRSGRS